MSFFKENPEKVMIILFPMITLALFVLAAILWWLIQNITQGQFGF
jgi:hypothetical protein